MKRLRTVVIGAGNVASHIVPALLHAGAIEPMAVWSRTEEHARELAGEIGAPIATADLDALPRDGEFYLVSTADDMLRRVGAIDWGGGALWAHTSGSVGADVLAGVSSRYGVFYPLQTFSREVAVEVREVPFFIEGSSEEVTATLTALARKISDRVYEADSELRTKMHVAAVFGCNFCNHLWALADELLRKSAGLDLGILKPLLKETLRKALENSPAEVQTGPARRCDEGVIAKHLAMLEGREAEIYRVMSESIMDYYR